MAASIIVGDSKLNSNEKERKSVIASHTHHCKQPFCTSLQR
jgi:hypothetical protein